MTPKRVVFVANASQSSGAGHVRRLIELSKGLPHTIERHFLGTIEFSWLKEIVYDNFFIWDPQMACGSKDLIILDSYEVDFCLTVKSLFPHSKIIQIADRYTFLLPDTEIIFMDLPFTYEDKSIASRVLAHGIEFLPIRSFRNQKPSFKQQAERVLVTTGGSIVHDITLMLAEEFTKDAYREISFDFIGHLETSTKYSPNLQFHDFGDSFDFIAGACDTAISAAGTTMWDLFANRILVGLGAVVENQCANLDYALFSNQALGVLSPMTMQLNFEALQLLFFDNKARGSLYEEISNKYDFLGAQRTSEVILSAL